jgi:DHA2 family multidrug resistance protein-like MFS transporter
MHGIKPGDDPCDQPPDVALPDGLAPPRRYVAVIAISLGTMVASLDSGSVNVALPTLARELHVAASSAVMLVTVYQLILIMALLPFSALGDRFGHRTVYRCGMGLFVAATPLCFVVHTLPMLVGVRAMQAVGAAATFSVASAMVRSIYPRAQLGRGMALNTMVATTSAAMAPSLGGVILSTAGWPWLFALCMPIGLLSLIISGKGLPDPERHQQPFDWSAAVMCAAMFGTAICGLEFAMQGANASVAAISLASALIIGVIFIRRELTQARPILPVDLLRDRGIALSGIALLTASVAGMILLLTLPFRLQQAFGYTVVEAGLMLAPWPMVSMVMAPASAILSDGAPAGLLCTIGMAVASVGLILLAVLPPEPSHFDVIWRIMLVAAGFGAFYSPNARQIIYAASLHRTAAAGGLTQTMRMTGQVLGSSLAAALLAAGTGLGAMPPLIAAGLASVALLCSAILLVGSSKARNSA